MEEREFDKLVPLAKDRLIFDLMRPVLQSLLKKASYHYADDTAKEWPLAVGYMDEFTKIAMDLRLRHDLLREMYSAVLPIMSFGSIIDRILRECYEKG